MGKKGLTLLEVILAMSITIVIIVILLSAFRLGHRSQSKGTERQEMAQRMRIICDRVSWLLRGAYPYKVIDEEGEETLYFSGGPSSVGLVTTSVDAYSESGQDRPGLKWITLSRGGEGLKISEGIYFLRDSEQHGSTETYVLEPAVQSIEFEYLDTADEKDVWIGEWNGEEKDYLPSAVRVSVVLEHDEQRMNMPPFTVAIRTGHPKKEISEE
jgi:hypothetical protein